MKKLFLVLLISILAMSFLLAAKTEVNDNENKPVLIASQGNPSVVSEGNDSETVIVMKEGKGVVENRPDKGLGNTTRARIEERVRLNNFNLSEEFDNTTNQTRLKTKLSNGRNAEIKVMPETASQRALEVLRTKCQNNCSIELKEVGKDNSTRLAYELKEEAKVRVFGLFKAKMKVQAQVDAETGEVIQAKRPWWSFLASTENSEEETESIAEIAVENESLEQIE